MWNLIVLDVFWIEVGFFWCISNLDYYVVLLDGLGKNNLYYYLGVIKYKYFFFIVSCIVNLGK